MLIDASLAQMLYFFVLHPLTVDAWKVKINKRSVIFVMSSFYLMPHAIAGFKVTLFADDSLSAVVSNLCRSESKHVY